MSDNTLQHSKVMPSATPTEAEIAQWQALPRDEQLRRMREALAHPDADKSSALTMEQIREMGRARAAARRG
jgi:hypothetical protein